MAEVTTILPLDLVAYHERGDALSCEIEGQSCFCEFWDLAQVLAQNQRYNVPEFAPGYLGFATDGGGEMVAISPSGEIVCLAMSAMEPRERVLVAPSWAAFEALLIQSANRVP